MKNSIQKIWSEINKITKNRRLSAKVKEVCRGAGISEATFYTHFKSCEDARDSYELSLQSDFLRSLPSGSGKEVTFTFLLVFVRKNREYFTPNLQINNTFLLSKILCRLEPVLSSPGVSDATYLTYMSSVIAVIMNWMLHEKATKQTMEKHIRSLCSIRMIKYID